MIIGRDSRDSHAIRARLVRLARDSSDSRATRPTRARLARDYRDSRATRAGTGATLVRLARLAHMKLVRYRSPELPIGANESPGLKIEFRRVPGLTNHGKTGKIKVFIDIRYFLLVSGLVLGSFNFQSF